MVLLSLTMFILELTVGVNGWPAGKVVGAIISLLCLIISAFALCLTYSGRNFNLRTISVNNVPVNIGDFTLDLDLYNYLKNGWIGFNSDEACRKQILQSRFLYFPLIAVLGLLSLTVVIEEFVIIGDWSCKNYSENWVDGVFWGVLCDCQYWAGISAACTIIFISLFFGGAYKPSWPVAMIAGTLTFGYGIFMAMITISSVQSLMIVGNFTDNDNPESNDLILEPVTNRFLHLLPIQYLAVLMITLGVSFIGHCFFKAQEPTDICRKIIKTASLIGVVILTVVNMTVTQIDVTEQLWKYWERRECDEYSYCHPALPWGIKNIYLLYLSSTLSLSLVLLGCACFKILHANRTIPGTINWILSLCMLGLTIFCIVVLFHDPYYVHFHDKKIVERMILKVKIFIYVLVLFVTFLITLVCLAVSLY